LDADPARVTRSGNEKLAKVSKEIGQIARGNIVRISFFKLAKIYVSGHKLILVANTF
jgi:hypothetical protein